MEKQYRISTGMRIFYNLLAAGIFIAAIYLFTQYNPAVSRALLVLPLAIALGAVWIILGVYKREIIIDEDSIRRIGLFSTTVLPIKGIKGARVGQKSIVLEAETPPGAKMVIRNVIDLSDSDELLKWAKETFRDLDADDLEQQKATVMQDPRFGSTETQRSALLKRTRTQAAVYNGVGLFLGFVMIFLPPLALTLIGITVPLAGIVQMVCSKGTIKYVSDSRRSVFAFTFLGFAIPCFTLLIRSMDASTVVSVKQLWLPGLGLAALVFVLLYRFGLNKSLGSMSAQILFMAIPALLYGFGAIRMANCTFDRSLPQLYTATVLDRRVAHGKSVSYYLTLSPWGPRKKDQEYEVSRAVYHSVQIDDSVTVQQKAGWLHIPWFTILPRDAPSNLERNSHD